VFFYYVEDVRNVHLTGRLTCCLRQRDGRSLRTNSAEFPRNALPLVSVSAGSQLHN